MRDLKSQQAEEIADIDALLRQLKRFQQQGTVDAETVKSITQRAKDYREQLVRPSMPGLVTVAEKPVMAQVVTPSPPVDRSVVPTEKSQPPVTALMMEKAPITAPKPEAVIPPTKPVVKPLAATFGMQAQQTIAPVASKTIPQMPSVPQKTWFEIFGGFLADRNIRWTELIGVLMGGLLMVGCSVLLVIAFWSQLESIPTLKFMIFVGYSSAVFAAGLFIYHRWKLESTGRGLMVIATLLVPLNFVAMASFYKEQSIVLTVATELISLSVFTWLVALAARVLTPAGRWSTVLSVIGNSIVVLIVARLFSEQFQPVWFLAAGCIPSLLLILSASSFLYFKPDQKKFDIAGANSLFMLLGIAVFCTAVALGLLSAQAVKSCGLTIALHCLTIPLALAAFSLLSVGLQIMRGMDDKSQSEGYRMAATTVAIIGLVLQLAAIVMAWPQPILIVVVGVIGAASLAYVALRYDFPVCPCRSDDLLGPGISGRFLCDIRRRIANPAKSGVSDRVETRSERNLLHATISARSGTALGGLFLAFAAISEWFALRGQKSHGKMYVGGAGIAAVVGLMLVTAHGWTGSYADAIRATILIRCLRHREHFAFPALAAICDSKLPGLEFAGHCANLVDPSLGVRCLAKHSRNGRLPVCGSRSLDSISLDTQEAGTFQCRTIGLDHSDNSVKLFMASMARVDPELAG